jgi:hypothetical protein
MKADARPEAIAVALTVRLGGHALRDLLLSFVPPLLALLGAAYLLARAGWLNPALAFVAAALTCGAAAGAVMYCHRRRVPKLPQAARLVDQRAGAKDHFLTLATVDPAQCPGPLLARLRVDAAALAPRVELERDFPYRVKNSTYGSVAGSLSFILLLYLLLPFAGARFHSPSTSAKLNDLAEKFAQAPRLKELAEPLKTLAAKLEDRKTPPQEKQSATEDLKQKITEQQKKEADQNNRDLLSQAAEELKGAEQQQSASGQEQQKSVGGGNLHSNLPKDGAGETKQSQGGGEGQGKTGTQQSKDMQQGKPSGNKDPGQEKNPQQRGDAKGDQPDPNQPGKEPNKDRAEKGQGGSKEGSGKNQASEEPPQSAPPAERFYRAGEGKEGLKGARYVTVQLPEDVAAESKGESKATKEGSGNRPRTQVPVSNTPLPAHVPNSANEKQQMPLEYRGIIK